MGVHGDQGFHGEAIVYFTMPAHSLFASEPPARGNDPPDGVEFAGATGLKLLVVIFFVVCFLLYVLALINSERQSAAARERHDEQPTGRMADSEQRPSHHVRSGGRSASSAEERTSATGEPGEPG
jgi:hypothetical protein